MPYDTAYILGIILGCSGDLASRLSNGPSGASYGFELGAYKGYSVDLLSQPIIQVFILRDLRIIKGVSLSALGITLLRPLSLIPMG